MKGVILGVVIALVIIVIARRWDRRRHEDRLKVIQDRIRRREEGAAGQGAAEPDEEGEK